MLAKEVIYNLRTNLEEVGSQLQSATDQHIMFMLDEARAKLASQKMDAKVNVVQMSQTIDVTPVEAPKEELGSIGTKAIKKLIIPDPIAYLNGHGIFSVGSTDGLKHYQPIGYSQLELFQHRSFTANTPKYVFLENSIYLINASPEANTTVRVRAIFDEPYKVVIANGKFNPFDPFDFEYPLSMKDMDSIYKIAMEGDLGWGDTAAQSINAAKSKQQKNQEFLNMMKGLTQGKSE